MTSRSHYHSVGKDGGLAVGSAQPSGSGVAQSAQAKHRSAYTSYILEGNIEEKRPKTTHAMPSLKDTSDGSSSTGHGLEGRSHIRSDTLLSTEGDIFSAAPKLPSANLPSQIHSTASTASSISNFKPFTAPGESHLYSWMAEAADLSSASATGMQNLPILPPPLNSIFGSGVTIVRKPLSYYVQSPDRETIAPKTMDMIPTNRSQNNNTVLPGVFTGTIWASLSPDNRSIIIKPSIKIDEDTLIETIALTIRGWVNEERLDKSLAGLSIFSGQYLFTPIVRDAQAWKDAIVYLRASIERQDIPDQSGIPHIDIVAHFMEASMVMPFLQAAVATGGDSSYVGVKINPTQGFPKIAGSPARIAAVDRIQRSRPCFPRERALPAAPPVGSRPLDPIDTERDPFALYNLIDFNAPKYDLSCPPSTKPLKPLTSGLFSMPLTPASPTFSRGGSFEDI